MVPHFRRDAPRHARPGARAASSQSVNSSSDVHASPNEGSPGVKGSAGAAPAFPRTPQAPRAAAPTVPFEAAAAAVLEGRSFMCTMCGKCCTMEDDGEVGAGAGRGCRGF